MRSSQYKSEAWTEMRDFLARGQKRPGTCALPDSAWISLLSGDQMLLIIAQGLAFKYQF